MPRRAFSRITSRPSKPRVATHPRLSHTQQGWMTALPQNLTARQLHALPIVYYSFRHAALMSFGARSPHFQPTLAGTGSGKGPKRQIGLGRIVAELHPADRRTNVKVQSPGNCCLRCRTRNRAIALNDLACEIEAIDEQLLDYEKRLKAGWRRQWSIQEQLELAPGIVVGLAGATPP